jgi:hypothetical protein
MGNDFVGREHFERRGQAPFLTLSWSILRYRPLRGIQQTGDNVQVQSLSGEEGGLPPLN